ncbi:hypothetical protein SO694_00170057 [Aureococcus anophagefferens]|uniref:Peptidase M28 domain-containing protein n=1 Tax=Aureococcus anophagefferens TaxID=44056 RepID=A0ABR1FZH7_AURAN
MSGRPSYRARRPSAASGCLDDYYTDTLGLGFTTEMTSGLGFSMPESHVPVVGEEPWKSTTGEETLAWATVVLAYAATLDATAPPSSPRTSRPSPRPSTRAPSAARARDGRGAGDAAPAPRRPFIGRRGRLFSAVGAGAGAIAAVVAAFFALVGLAALIVSRRARARRTATTKTRSDDGRRGRRAGRRAARALPRRRRRDRGRPGGDPGIELV